MTELFWLVIAKTRDIKTSNARAIKLLLFFSIIINAIIKAD